MIMFSSVTADNAAVEAWFRNRCGRFKQDQTN